MYTAVVLAAIVIAAPAPLPRTVKKPEPYPAFLIGTFSYDWNGFKTAIEMRADGTYSLPWGSDLRYVGHWKYLGDGKVEFVERRYDAFEGLSETLTYCIYDLRAEKIIEGSYTGIELKLGL